MAKCNGVFVFKKPDESVDSLIQRFKRKFKQSKVSQQYSDSGFFLKPSTVKRAKKISSKIRKKKILELTN